ncbi:histone H3-like [Phalacrocorax carbo]|uniref:histone H3-like n=1 Tax=Phalacrocorax carbo TaxID=9209 RepID=UPI00311A7E77
MARAKQAAAKKPPKNAPSPAPKPPKNACSRAPKPPKTRPPPRRPPSLWEKLRRSPKPPLGLLPAASFRASVRSAAALREGFGVQAGAAAALREGCEAHLLALLEAWGLCALHAKRSVVRVADVSLVRSLRVKRG